MRAVHYGLILGALTGALACGDIDNGAQMRAPGADETPASATGGAGGTGASTGTGNGTGPTGVDSGTVGTGNPGAGGSPGTGGDEAEARRRRKDAGTGSGGAGGASASDAAVALDATGAGGGGAADPNDAGAVADAAAGWLHTAGNHLYRGTAIFHGRGANFHDTRSCNACAYSPPNVAEVNRRADELIDNWKANFIRFDLESEATADNRVQWQGILDDPTYQADVKTMVTHVTAKGAYVLLALWIDPSTTANELPTEATNAIWRKLATMFKDDPRVLYGITNEPHNDTNETVWAAMNTSVAAIRLVEAQAGTPPHIISVQGTQQWARYLDYYVTHPITAGGGVNIIYETHVYDPATEFNALFEGPGRTIPVVIGEFGEQDADALMQRAEAAQIPYLAWTFHGRCHPNLLIDNSGGGCGVGMTLTPSPFGQKLKARLATAW
ncbi:MAG TPA: cellulase family glycosylhydrolase [Polyangiaceae bacterium]|nr:cellulase family glycosylhydrolase [Polyangiaceae bacterium]